MRFLVTEKAVPAFRQVLLCAVLAASPCIAFADAETDYKAGLDAYRVNDIAGSMPPLKRAADAGHAAAQALYGEILDSAELDDLAAEYLHKAASQQNPEGMYGLAKMYMTGEAAAPDPDAAGRLLRAAAAADNRSAIIALAGAYVRGDAKLGATEQTSEEARQFILKAASFGDMGAMSALVDGYRTGKYGLMIDEAKAKDWETKLSNILAPVPRRGTR